MFEIPTGGGETVIHSFQGGSDGSGPFAALVADDNGNMYGTTAFGGSENCIGVGCGTVFMVAPDGTETVLYPFQGGSDGFGPMCTLIFDGLGNLYGTTPGGGEYGDYGTVFELSPENTKTVLHSFRAGNDGDGPDAGVIMDSTGALFGTTSYGGGARCHGHGCGTVFKVAPDGHETVLSAFGGSKYPEPALLEGANRILYGTATAGGSHGVVFRVRE